MIWGVTKVRKAVIPAAGFGTRFLPMTKAMPKEMLPVVDKPVIQIEDKRQKGPHGNGTPFVMLIIKDMDLWRGKLKMLGIMTLGINWVICKRWWSSGSG